VLVLAVLSMRMGSIGARSGGCAGVIGMSIGHDDGMDNHHDHAISTSNDGETRPPNDHDHDDHEPREGGHSMSTTG